MKHFSVNSKLTSQDHFGMRLATRLSDSTDALPQHVVERLRASRVQALDRFKQSKAVTTSSIQISGGAATLSFGNESGGVWRRIASVLPLLALVAGLVAVNMLDRDTRVRELAEIDAAILTDDLPPAAYTDPGFVQFLSAKREESQ
jgi:hypothetical protein